MKINRNINGSTKVFGIIGNPVEHSFSPVMQSAIGSKKKVNMVYAPFLVSEKGLESAVKGGYNLGIEGFNITVPHKKNVIPFLLEIDEMARQIGAVNTLKRIDGGYKGFNTDILGLEKSMRINNIEMEGKVVVVLGAGGASNAAIVLACQKKAAKIYIVNRTIKTAIALKEEMEQYFNVNIEVLQQEEIMAIKKASIVIQTTAVGMGEGNKESPVANKQFFANVDTVIDIIYTPWETKLLKDAREQGCVAINGFEMLVYQGIASFEIWNNTKIKDEEALEMKNALEVYYQGGEL